MTPPLRGSPGPASVAGTAEPGMRRGFWVGLLALGLLLGLLWGPLDDGLRHVGLAFGEARSWGEVYPFSQFADRGGYDPWLGHDLLLRGLAWGLGRLPLSRLGQELLASKLLSCAFVLAVLFLAARGSRVAAELRDGRGLAVAMSSVVLLLAPALRRARLIRPFTFGTFYLLYAAPAAGAWRGLLASGLLFFFYPYLAWLYTVPAALAHLLRGSRAFGVGALLASGIGVAVQPAAFWGLVSELFHADRVRATLDPEITEFASVLSDGLAFATILVLLVLALPRFSPAARRLGPGHLMALAFVVPSLRYVRYLSDAVLPLLFVVFAREAVRVFAEPLGRLVESWRALWPRRRQLAPEARPGHGEARPPKRRSLVPVLIPLYALVLAAAASTSAASFREAQRMHRLLQPVPPGGLLLSEFNKQYLALYVRPDLRVVPSSELGFPAASIASEYRAFFNAGAVCPLARGIGAAFYLEERGQYLDPRSAECLELAGEQQKARLWRVLPASARRCR